MSNQTMTFVQASERPDSPIPKRKAARKYPLLDRVGRAICAQIMVRWLTLANRFARAPICQGDAPVVSLTTHGNRIFTVHLTIESIARGTLRPSRIILWLDEVDRYRSLPVALQRLQGRGLEVRLCRNFGPHTKYYPYVQSTKTNTLPLATADDDILYPAYWLKQLNDAFHAFPDCVNCYRARVIKLEKDEVVPYEQWQECKGTEPSFRYLATGVSGVIYAPQFLNGLRASGSIFEKCCPRADDLWLHVQALRSGYKIRQIAAFPRHFPLIPGTQKATLSGINVTQDGNDQQMKSTYTRKDLEVLHTDCVESLELPALFT